MHGKYKFFIASFEKVRNAYVSLDLELLSEGTGYAMHKISQCLNHVI